MFKCCCILQFYDAAKKCLLKQTILQTWSLKLISMLSTFNNKFLKNIAEIGKKLRAASPNLKFTFAYKKKRVNICILFYCRLSITVILTYIFCLFLESKQTNYHKICKFCLFMMHKLNVKRPVTQAGGQRGSQLSCFQPNHFKTLIHEYKRLYVFWTLLKKRDYR